MDRLTYLKGERSLARKELKNYLIMFRDDIEQECGIELPTKKEIREFTSLDFDDWFMSVNSKVQEKECEDLTLIELIESYICAINNVAIVETSNENDIYF